MSRHSFSAQMIIAFIQQLWKYQNIIELELIGIVLVLASFGGRSSFESCPSKLPNLLLIKSTQDDA